MIRVCAYLAAIWIIVIVVVLLMVATNEMSVDLAAQAAAEIEAYLFWWGLLPRAGCFMRIEKY